MSCFTGPGPRPEKRVEVVRGPPPVRRAAPGAGTRARRARLDRTQYTWSGLEYRAPLTVRCCRGRSTENWCHTLCQHTSVSRLLSTGEWRGGAENRQRRCRDGMPPPLAFQCAGQAPSNCFPLPPTASPPNRSVTATTCPTTACPTASNRFLPVLWKSIAPRTPFPSSASLGLGYQAMANAFITGVFFRAKKNSIQQKRTFKGALSALWSRHGEDTRPQKQY